MDEDQFELMLSRHDDNVKGGSSIVAVLMRIDGADGCKSVRNIIYLDDRINASDDLMDVAKWLLGWTRNYAPVGTLHIAQNEFVEFGDDTYLVEKIYRLLSFLTGPYARAGSDRTELLLYIAHTYHDCLLGTVRPERARRFLRWIYRLGELSTDRTFAATMVELTDEAAAYQANLYCSAS